MAFYRDVLGFVVGEEWRENGTLEGCEMACRGGEVLSHPGRFSQGFGTAKRGSAAAELHDRADPTGSPPRSKHAGPLDQEPMDNAVG